MGINQVEKIDDRVPVRRVLVSVSDKTGLEAFVPQLLALNPEILFLDEPTVGLDPQTRNHIWTYIHELNKKEGITIFFTTHYMDEAERAADWLVIIDKGKIVAQGTPAELKKLTKATTLEDAFIQLTGRSIRAEEGTFLDRMRLRRRLRR